jgi:cation diffusion facilitator family transporter
MKIISPEPVAFTWVTALVLILSVCVKLWLSLFNGKLAKLIRSTTLEATAQDSRNDCISTAAVLICALVEKFSGLTLDGFVGLGVSVFIFVSGIRLARETISPLLGEGASEELQGKIVDYISTNPLVLGFHDLYVHDYGPGRRFASLHVVMDCKQDPLLCHEVIDDMERECLNSHGIQLVIHYDPVVTDDPELDRLHQLVDGKLKTYDQRLRTHDFRMVQGNSHTNLIFDVSLPHDLQKQGRHIQEYLQQELAQEGKTYYLVITFDV